MSFFAKRLLGVRQMLSWSPMRFQAREIYWGKDDPEIAGQSTGPLKWTRNGGWMEIRGASKTTPFFSDVFWRAYFIHHDLHGADFWSLPTGQTHELSTRRFFLGGCCRTFQVKFVPPFFFKSISVGSHQTTMWEFSVDLGISSRKSSGLAWPGACLCRRRYRWCQQGWKGKWQTLM